MRDDTGWQLSSDDAPVDARPLKAHLFEAYRGFADKRVKDLDKRDIFTVDDRDPGHDFGSDGGLYGWFCCIFARVTGAHSIEVDLSGGVPMSTEIQAWIEAGNAKLDDRFDRARLVVPIELGQEERLRDLATLIQRIVRLGAPRYSVRAYKHVCPRAAGSLRHLADVLATAPDG